MRSVFAFGGGFGGSEKAYAAFCKAYATRTRREVHFIPSLRRGTPLTPLWYPQWHESHTIEPFAYQAAHFADKVRNIVESSGSEPVELHLGAHSFEVPVVARFASLFVNDLLYTANFRARVQLKSLTVLCPGGVYEEPAWRLEARIARMATRDVLISSAGRTYWLNSGGYLFRNVQRSLREGTCIASNPVTTEWLAELPGEGEERAVDVKVFLAPDDNAFSYSRTRRVLAPFIPCLYDLPVGTGHNPQFKPERLLKTLEENGALYL